MKCLAEDAMAAAVVAAEEEAGTTRRSMPGVLLVR